MRYEIHQNGHCITSNPPQNLWNYCSWSTSSRLPMGSQYLCCKTVVLSATSCMKKTAHTLDVGLIRSTNESAPKPRMGPIGNIGCLRVGMTHRPLTLSITGRPRMGLRRSPFCLRPIWQGFYLDLLLMEEIRRTSCSSSFSRYLQGFVHHRWCRISSINSSMTWLQVLERAQIDISWPTAARQSCDDSQIAPKSVLALQLFVLHVFELLLETASSKRSNSLKATVRGKHNEQQMTKYNWSDELTVVVDLTTNPVQLLLEHPNYHMKSYTWKPAPFDLRKIWKTVRKKHLNKTLNKQGKMGVS